jgi:PIN domain nuclease of toxin-antitoxin system
MSKVVLDASAVLAVLHKEPGADLVLARIGEASISAVNFAEVVTRLAKTGNDLSQVLTDLHNLLGDIRPFDLQQAEAAGVLDISTRRYGLSLGDRACLVLAQHLNLPVLTADHMWAKLEIGVTIELIRGTLS